MGLWGRFKAAVSSATASVVSAVSRTFDRIVGREPAPPPPSGGVLSGGRGGHPGGLTPDEVKALEEWGSSIPPPDSIPIPSDLDRVKVDAILDSLRDMEVSEDVLEKLSEVAWDDHYYIRVVMKNYHSTAFDDSPAHAEGFAERALAFVDSGGGVLSRVIDLAYQAEVVSVEIHPLLTRVEGRPLWAADTITLRDGTRLQGEGVRPARVKRGRPPKRGRRPKAETQKLKANARVARYRETLRQEKYLELMETDPKAAALFKQRSIAGKVAARNKQRKPR